MEGITPKEKAVELVKKMHPDKMWTATDWKEAKKCALIAVDEILEMTKKPKYNPFNWNEITGFHYDKYWQEVKQEIEKL